MIGHSRVRAAAVACVAVAVVAAALAGRATAAQSGGDPAAVAPSAEDSTAKPTESHRSPGPRTWFEAGFSAAYESNLEHDDTDVRSFGVAPSLAFHFQDRAEKPLVSIDYEVASNRYTNSERFDRVSHYLSAELERRLSRRWSVEGDVELSLRGSSEDRDVSNQYLATGRVAYRLTPATQIEPFVGYRIRRYPIEDVGQNAVNPFAGLRLKQRFEGDRRLVLGYRYDLNRSEDPRYRYIRRTWDVSYETPFPSESDRITLDAAYKTRTYLDRLVEVGDVRVPRHDSGWWVLDANRERPLGRGFRLGLHYRFETRGSNDPEKTFAAHQAGCSIRYRW
jgi:hypothetical protein